LRFDPFGTTFRRRACIGRLRRHQPVKAGAVDGHRMNAPPPHATIKAVVPAERRSKFTTLRYVLRNPLEGWPEEVYHAPLVRTRTMGHPTLFVMDPDLIREVMVEKADAFHKDPATKRALGPALGRGILTADGAHWRWQRRLASPVFRHENVQTFLPAIVAAAGRTRDEWAAAEGRQIDVLHAMMRTTFDIIVQTMLAGAPDMNVDRVAESITAYLRTSGWAVAMALLRAPPWMPYPGRRRARRSGSYLRDALQQAITARRDSGASGSDLTDLLLAASDPQG
jgi:cytochrome P450